MNARKAFESLYPMWQAGEQVFPGYWRDKWEAFNDGWSAAIRALPTKDGLVNERLLRAAKEIRLDFASLQPSEQARWIHLQEFRDAIDEATIFPAHTDHPSRDWDRTCPACIAESATQPTLVTPSESDAPSVRAALTDAQQNTAPGKLTEDDYADHAATSMNTPTPNAALYDDSTIKAREQLGGAPGMPELRDTPR